MEFGLFSNGERMNQLALKTYDEDLFEVATADKLGFQEAWISGGTNYICALGAHEEGGS